MDSLLSELEKLAPECAPGNQSLLDAIIPLAARLAQEAPKFDAAERQRAAQLLQPLVATLGPTIAASVPSSGIQAFPGLVSLPLTNVLFDVTGTGLLGGGIGVAGAGTGTGTGAGGGLAVAPTEVLAPSAAEAIRLAAQRLLTIGGPSAAVGVALLFQYLVLSGLVSGAIAAAVAAFSLTVSEGRRLAERIIRDFTYLRIVPEIEGLVGQNGGVPAAVDERIDELFLEIIGKLLPISKSVAEGASGKSALKDLAALIDDLILGRFRRDLAGTTGIPYELLTAKLLRLKEDIKQALVAVGFPLLPGPESPPELREAVRNGLRKETLEGNVKGFHRKGGFAYEEFDDDRNENPDISAEDPAADVETQDVSVQPGLDLSVFTDAELARRKRALERFIDKQLELLSELDAEIERLRDDPDAREALGQRLIERDVLVGEIRRLKAALRNTLIECYRRAQEYKDQPTASDLLEKIKLIKVLNP